MWLSIVLWLLFAYLWPLENLTLRNIAGKKQTVYETLTRISKDFFMFLCSFLRIVFSPEMLFPFVINQSTIDRV